MLIFLRRCYLQLGCMVGTWPDMLLTGLFNLFAAINRLTKYSDWRSKY